MGRPTRSSSTRSYTVDADSDGDFSISEGIDVTDPNVSDAESSEEESEASGVHLSSSDSDSDEEGPRWARVTHNFRKVNERREAYNGAIIKQGLLHVVTKSIRGKKMWDAWVVVRDDCLLIFDIEDKHVATSSKYYPKLPTPMAVFLWSDVRSIYRKKTASDFVVLTHTAKERFRCPDVRSVKDWLKPMIALQKEYSAQKHPEVPFTVPRHTKNVEFYVGGREYFCALYSALLSAKKEIFIADWMMSPKIHLIRGKVTESKFFKAGNLLHHIRSDSTQSKDSQTRRPSAASAGLRDSDEEDSPAVPRSVLGIATRAEQQNDPTSKWRTAVQGKILEPKRNPWAKTLSMTKAMVRRKPLRRKHRLDSILQKKAGEGVKIYVLLYREFDQALQLKSYETKKYLQSLHPNIHVMRHGPPWSHIYFSHHQKIVCIDQKKAYVGGLDLAVGRFDDKQHVLGDAKGEVFTGLDYYNPDVNTFRNTDDPEKAVIDQSRVPRLPWHDVHCMVEGKGAADVALNFVQRWNHHRLQNSAVKAAQSKPSRTMRDVGKSPSKSTRYIGPDESSPTLELSQTIDVTPHKTNLLDLQELAASKHETLFSNKVASALNIHHHQSSNADEISKLRNFSPPLAPRPLASLRRAQSGNCQIQICRSMGKWHGSLRHEASIHSAYLDAIKHAKKFIYIENQFFVSGPSAKDVHNGVVDALIARIAAAIEKKENFKVIIILPVYPEGNLSRDVSVRAVMHYQFRTMCRGPHSMLQKLADLYPEANLEEYVAIFSLRKFGSLSGELVTSRIYIHSKLLIADDAACIIGSANINDRSLNGDRDSEIAAYVSNSHRGRVLKQIRKFRLRLMGRHVGMQKSEFAKLTNIHEAEVFADLWLRTARRNTRFFELVFDRIPSDHIATLGDYKKRQVNWVAKHAEKLAEVRGHLILYPLEFLKEENLRPKRTTVESLTNNSKLYG